MIKTSFCLMSAPLEQHSHFPLRLLCHKYGADLTFTEMVHLRSLVRKNKLSLDRLDLSNNINVPTQIQLLVNNVDLLKTFLQSFQPRAGFQGFNLNIGCPSPDVIQAGLGCASVKRITKTQQIIDCFKEHGHSISIKLRLGLNQFEKSNKVYLKLIEKTDPDFFIVHARHGKQKYGEPADFSVYDECVKTGKIIIANGDISKLEHIKQLKSIGVRGAMIGRASVWNPAIFDMLNGKEVPPISDLKEEYIKLVHETCASNIYKENVLKRMGSNSHLLDKNLLI